MKIKKIGKIGGGQDGAIWGDELFRFDARGTCTVYDLARLSGTDGELAPLARFTLDRAEELTPHSNAVAFGCDFYEAGDRYPLLYTNIYNNYSAAEDKMMGICLVYRITRTGDVFASRLVQCIAIGFCEDASLWKVHSDRHGVRPYGNFAVDRDARAYWAFVMRDEALGTRYFRFDLPSPYDGEEDVRFGVRKVTLRREDIRESFDGQYCRFMQGATVCGGVLYSTEGFCADKVNRPAIRRRELATRREEYADIMECGFADEPEFIDFYEGKCLYGDIGGNLYEVAFSPF